MSNAVTVCGREASHVLSIAALMAISIIHLRLVHTVLHLLLEKSSLSFVN
jgi:hypothetical protein